MSDREIPEVPPALARATALSWRLLVVGAAVAVVVLILVQLRLVVLPLIAALLLATYLAPPTRWLERRGVPRTLSTLLVMLIALLALIGVFLAIIPPIVAQVDEFSETVWEGVQLVRQWINTEPFGIPTETIVGWATMVQDELQGILPDLVTGILTGAMVGIEIVAGAILTIPFLFFFLRDADRIRAWLLALAGDSRRDLANALGARAWTTLGAYFRGVTIVALVDAVFIGLGLFLIGVPLILPLMVLTFIGGFFPIVGATVAGLAAVLIALVAGGLIDAVLVLIVVLVVQQVEGNVLEPLVVGRAVRVHPLTILVALTAGAAVAGVIGAFFAVPLAALVTALGHELRQWRSRPALPAASEGEPATVEGETSASTEA